MNKGLISGLVLLTIGLICGLLLSVVNHFTADKILEEENKIKYAVLEEFYVLSDFDLSEVELTGSFGTVYILKEKGTSNILSLVYTVKATGYSASAPVQMLIAVNNDLTVEGYRVVSHQESSGFGADIVENDFNVLKIDDLSGFASVAGITVTSDAIKACFTLIGQRVVSDFGGGLNE